MKRPLKGRFMCGAPRTQQAHHILVSVVRFRPGPPRNIKTLEVVHRISSVGRGLAPFLLDIPI